MMIWLPLKMMICIFLRNMSKQFYQLANLREIRDYTPQIRVVGDVEFYDLLNTALAGTLKSLHISDFLVDEEFTTNKEFSNLRDVRISDDGGVFMFDCGELCRQICERSPRLQRSTLDCNVSKLEDWCSFFKQNQISHRLGTLHHINGPVFGGSQGTYFMGTTTTFII
eukprot:TRINITY_DN17943_c0_g2_i1.p1 TRINITY_DN17943_c0_g2~~TRINITY_DN17943_c0_g2_i1.p1  ORF type:complete len:168 (-),score=36.84 TRINITY_DN17943_c0_g2_i1:660-1163(-)